MTTIFLDLDGVLADFVSGAIAAAELPVTAEQVEHWNFFEEYMDDDEFTKRINDTMYFWDDLAVYPWAHELVGYLKTKGDIVYCTSPGNHDEAATGKLNWLRRHGFLSKHSKNYVLTHYKWLLAGRDRILVDDSDQQCRSFELSGGASVIFPQKWNRMFDWASDPTPFACVTMQMGDIERECWKPYCKVGGV
jgi:5'(3')-deoxyribonucleotidase